MSPEEIKQLALHQASMLNPTDELDLIKKAMAIEEYLRSRDYPTMEHRRPERYPPQPDECEACQ